MYLKDEKKDSNSSIDRKLSALRGFYNYLASKKIVSNNVFLLVSGLKKDKKLPRYFEYNELEELFKIPDLNTPLGKRDSLILEMLYATGMRVGELVNIKVSDIRKFEKEFLEYMDTHHRDLLKSIVDGKVLTDEIKEELEVSITEFKKIFLQEA